jgi:hypothetical protein
MLHKAPNSCQAAIASDGGVPAHRFNMIQKREYGVGLYIFEHELRHGLSLLIRQKHKEELQRVAISPHGMTARSARALEVLAEEAFSQCQE